MEPAHKVERLEIDTSEGSAFQQAVTYGSFAADAWWNEEVIRRWRQSDAELSHTDQVQGQVSEALLHLAELGFITINGDVIGAMPVVPATRKALR